MTVYLSHRLLELQNPDSSIERRCKSSITYLPTDHLLVIYISVFLTAYVYAYLMHM